MSYHRFKADDGSEYGSFEVFWHEGGDPDFVLDPGLYADAPPAPAGWYWWACFPGCLPDGDPWGPFDTEADAIKAAQEDA